MEEEDDVTTINQQLGNRFLLLPELVSGNKEQKRLVESDISQACAIFFYLMTGTIPNALLDGDGKMPHRRIEANDIIRNKISNDVVRQNIFHIFDKAFSNNVSERYHSVTEIYDDLKMLEEIKVNEMGKEIIMKNEIINVEIENEKELYRYSELMRQLNPCTEICNPAGLTCI